MSALTSPKLPTDRPWISAPWVWAQPPLAQGWHEEFLQACRLGDWGWWSSAHASPHCGRENPTTISSCTEPDGELERNRKSRHGYVFTAVKAWVVQLADNVTCNYKNLGEGAALGTKARNDGTGCQVTALRKLLYLQISKLFNHGFQQSNDGFKPRPKGVQRQARHNMSRSASHKSVSHSAAPTRSPGHQLIKRLLSQPLVVTPKASWR
jgi:hypothetical protein